MQWLRKPKIKIFLCRFRDVICYWGIFTAIAVFLPDSFYRVLIVHFQSTAFLGYSLGYCISALLCMGVWVVLNSEYGVLYLKKVPYIPSWLVFIVGVFIFYLFAGLKLNFAIPYITILVILLLSFFLVWILDYLIKRKILHRYFVAKNIKLGNEYEDKPIQTAREDRFEFAGLAEKLAEKLKKGKSISIIGKYGSGKSSLINLIKEEIENKPDRKEYFFCKIDSRGRSADTFASCVLKSALSEVKKKIDILPVSDISGQYIQSS